MKFSDYRIAPEIKQNLDHLGMRRPTDIQYKAIPPILNGEDVLAVAQTGTGKTAAFAIPLIHLLHIQKSSKGKSGVKALVMVPTHELAIQITSVFHELARGTRVRAFGIFGGVDQEQQIATLSNGVDILVATPGRMFDLYSQGQLDLSTVEILVLDEADHMLDLGFIRDIRQLKRKLRRRKQTLFFSATIDDQIKDIAYSLVKDAIRIQISPDNRVAQNIDHAVVFVRMEDKRFFLERLIREQEGRKVLVFVRTKVRADRVQKAMQRVQIDSLVIHGDKDQDNRRDVMKAFRSGEVSVMIATDISARGVDIEQVEYVVNYDLPQQVENYVHRVGRTGRAKRRGQAVSFCSEEERDTLKRIEMYLGHDIEVLDIAPQAYEDTLVISADQPHDWKSLMAEAEQEHPRNKKRKKRK